MKKCQTCKGEGKYSPVHINKGDQPHEWVESMKCSDCSGTGEWSDERYEAWRCGQALRQIRVDRRESLFEAATRMGISPAELSAREHGRRSPSTGRGS